MTKYLLTDWEINGYDDSDFMCSYYDDVTNKLGFYCYGTTRAAAPTMIGIGENGVTSVSVDGEALILPTAEAVEKARLLLEEYIFQTVTAADKRRVEEPDVKELHKGLRVRLLADARMQIRAMEPCRKCNGSGKWVNPNRPSDQRDCFGCRGTGQHAGGKVQINGKQAYEKLPAGLAGEVSDWNSFGTFYANGYNKPGRENTTVQFKVDGKNKIVRASLSKLRLDRECEQPSVLREKAKGLSFNYSFSAMGPKFAWDTRNYAALVAKGL